MLWLLAIIEVMAAFKGNLVNVVVTTHKNKRQQRISNFGCCILYDPRAMLRLLPIMELLASFLGNIVNVNVTTRKNKHQQSVIRAPMVLPVAC
jgi:hypothetical protein